MHTVIETPTFISKCRRYRVSDDEREAIIGLGIIYKGCHLRQAFQMEPRSSLTGAGPLCDVMRGVVTCRRGLTHCSPPCSVAFC